MLRWVLALLVLGYLPIVPSRAETAPAQPKTCLVYVDHEGDDPVGARLALAVKERIQGSPLFRLADRREGSAYTVSLMTIDPDETVLADRGAPLRGSVTAASVVWLVTAISVVEAQNIYVVGTKACCQQPADEIVATLGKIVTKHERRICDP